MATRGQYIFQLARKIDVIVEAMVDLGRLQKRSRPALAEYIAVPYPTLKSACSISQISDELVRALEQSCQLNAGHAEWNDKTVSEEIKRAAKDKYPGRDTAAAFRSAHRESCGLKDRHTLAVEIFEVRHAHPDLAAFALSDAGQDAPPNGPVQIFLESDFSPSYHPSGFFYGFGRVRFRVFVSEDTVIEITDRLGVGKAVQLSNAQLTARGTSRDPMWELHADEGILEGEYRTDDRHLFQIMNATDETVLEVELSAQLHDGTLARSDGSTMLEEDRKAIVRRLMAKRIDSEPSKHGRVVLGKHKLRIVRSKRK